MSDFTADFQRIIDEELGNYSGKVLALLAAQIQAKGLVLTEDLLKSLQADTVATTADLLGQMRVEFAQYGRIQEMKGRTWSQAPPIEELERFVRKRGLASFDYIPGYSAKSKVSPVSSRAINRIAWGISRARLRDQDGPKPRAWFAKTFYRSLNSFIDAVTTRYAGQTGKHLAAAIQF